MIFAGFGIPNNKLFMSWFAELLLHTSWYMYQTIRRLMKLAKEQQQGDDSQQIHVVLTQLLTFKVYLFCVYHGIYVL